MMNFVYSANDNMFYPYAYQGQYIANDDWPVDGINVSDEVFAEFTGSPPVGKVRVVGDDGLPAWGNVPAPSQEDLIAAADGEKQNLINQANVYINAKQWPSKLALGRLLDSEQLQFNVWLDYIDALNAVDTSTAPNIEWPVKPE